MFTKTISAIALMSCIAVASADVLVSWGDGVQEVDYDWLPDLNVLTIYHGNGLDYKFWFHDGSEEPGTGVIDNITVDPNAVGDFSLLIAYPLDPNDPNSPVDPNEAGALDWSAGDLTYAGGTSTVTGVKVAGVLAAPTKQVAVDRLDGWIEVGGAVDSLKIARWLSGSPPWVIDVAGDVRRRLLSGAAQ
jgi:hypothetical protein